MRKIKIKQTTATTLPGYRNKHGQVVVRDTGFPSSSFPGQRIYEMRCGQCQVLYGSNGCDVHLRRCPGHGGGSPGEPLRKSAGYLFEQADWIENAS